MQAAIVKKSTPYVITGTVLLGLGAGLTSCWNFVSNDIEAERRLASDFREQHASIVNTLKDYVAERKDVPLVEQAWATNGSGYEFKIGQDSISAKYDGDVNNCPAFDVYMNRPADHEANNGRKRFYYEHVILCP